MRREVDPDDQRVTRVFLTAEGRRQEMENRAAFEEYVQQTIGKLSRRTTSSNWPGSWTRYPVTSPSWSCPAAHEQSTSRGETS